MQIDPITDPAMIADLVLLEESSSEVSVVILDDSMITNYLVQTVSQSSAVHVCAS